MTWRKRAPSPGGRRLVEMGKNILIGALTCSALFLAWQTPIASRFHGWMGEPSQIVESEDRQPSQAILPYGIAVRNNMGLYGVSYDETLVERAFETLSPLLGEGLSTGAPAESISRLQWQAMLELPGVCCAFQGAPALQVLSGWLGEENVLPGGAEQLLLCWDGAQVWLCWQQGDGFFRAGTEVVYEGHMDEVLETFAPNGAAFAYTLARDDGIYERLDESILVTMLAPQPPVYTCESPDFVGDGEAREQLLALLGFQSGASSSYESAGEMAISESGDRLRLSSGGKVTFHAGEDVRYGVEMQGDTPTAQEAALASWQLLSRAAGPWKGEGEFVLTGAQKMEEGWEITFHSRWSGVPVLTGREGWCARFIVTEKGIQDFTIMMRTCTRTGDSCVVPTQRLAAAALGALPEAGGNLVLCYRVEAGAALTASWVVDEGKS